jgi:hypothetical protein
VRPALPALALLLWPRVAAACATCLSTPYGDRTYNWAFLGLLLMPFLVAAAVGGVLVRALVVRRRADASRLNLRTEETT